MNRPTRKKINKGSTELELDQMGLTDKKRTVHPVAAEYIFFSTAR